MDVDNIDTPSDLRSRVLGWTTEFSSAISQIGSAFSNVCEMIEKIEIVRRGECATEQDLDQIWRFLKDVDRAVCAARCTGDPVAVAFLRESAGVELKSPTEMIDNHICIRMEDERNRLAEPTLEKSQPEPKDAILISLTQRFERPDAQRTLEQYIDACLYYSNREH